MSTDKIRVQAYVEGGLHEKFEQERISWGLNPSKAIEKILGERYGVEKSNNQWDLQFGLEKSKIDDLIADLNERLQHLELAFGYPQNAKTIWSDPKPFFEVFPDLTRSGLSGELPSELPSELELVTSELDLSKGVSQRTLAKRLKVSHPHLGKIQKLGELGSYSKALDPDGIAWEFRDKKYYPCS